MSYNARLLFIEEIEVREANDSVVDQVYEKLKEMSIGYSWMPGERINERDLAHTLGVSRTPLREALARLHSEKFFDFLPGKGYFCRRLDVQEIFSLYELRKTIEVGALALSISRAQDEAIENLLAFLDQTGPDPGNRSIDELVQLDEHYHESLIAMSGNPEMVAILRSVNQRIRFVRWVDIERRDRCLSQETHKEVLLALKARDHDQCARLLTSHIDRRMDDIASSLKAGFAHLYMKSHTQ